jgi:hypothetical protein
MAFLDERTLQAVIDRAVYHYLRHLGGELAGFTEAVDAAEANVAQQRANVRRLDRDE